MARWIDMTDAQKAAIDRRARPAAVAAALAEAQQDVTAARAALAVMPSSILRAGALRRAEERLAVVREGWARA